MYNVAWVVSPTTQTSVPRRQRWNTKRNKNYSRPPSATVENWKTRIRVYRPQCVNARCSTFNITGVSTKREREREREREHPIFSVIPATGRRTMPLLISSFSAATNVPLQLARPDKDPAASIGSAARPPLQPTLSVTTTNISAHAVG